MRGWNFVGTGEPLKVFEQGNGMVRALPQEDNGQEGENGLLW